MKRAPLSVCASSLCASFGAALIVLAAGIALPTSSASALDSMGIDEAGEALAPGQCTQLARTKYPWVRCEDTSDGALTFSGPTRSASWANSTTMLVFDRWMEEQHVFTPISLRPSP